MLAAFAVERCGDEVAHAAARVDVLGGKQPVIAAEVHTAAELKSLAEQAGRDTARCCRRRCLRKEDPHISVFDTPSAASNTIRARCADPAITVEDRVNDTNVSRSPSRNPSGAIRMHNYPKPALQNHF